MAKYYFKNTAVKHSKNLWKDTRNLQIKYSEYVDCNCGSCRCSGKYVKSRDYQEMCLHGIIQREMQTKNIKYKIVKPNTEFQLWREFEKQFAIDENTIFTFENTIYTSNDLPDHLIEHEKIHMLQQNAIGADTWVFKYLHDKDFRLKQEIEAYKWQLMQVKDRNAKSKLKTEIIKHLSGPMYGNIATEEEVTKLLKE